MLVVAGSHLSDVVLPPTAIGPQTVAISRRAGARLSASDRAQQWLRELETGEVAGGDC